MSIKAAGYILVLWSTYTRCIDEQLRLRQPTHFHLFPFINACLLMAFGMDIYAIIIISFCIGQQQKLEGEAAYRLGLSYEKTGDGETALLVSIELTGDCCFVAFCHLLMIFTTVWTQIRPDKMFDFLIVFLKDFFKNYCFWQVSKAGIFRRLPGHL